jgi:hypothetical protein
LSCARNETPSGKGERDAFLSAVLAFVSLALPGTAPRAAEEEPALDRLLEINSAEVFGDGGIKVSTDLGVKIEFKGDGRFNKLFQSRSGGGRGFISKLEEAKAQAIGQKLLDKAEDVFSLIAIEGGTATSRFELADDFTIKFLTKIPSGAGTFMVLVNQQDGRNYISTSFFQDILVLDGGRKRRKPTSHKHFQSEPMSWFDKGSEKGVPVEIAYKEKKLSIFLETKLDKKAEKAERVEVVSQEGIEKPSSGKVVLSFNKLSLLIGNLSIEGKLSRPWAEAAVAKLRKDGKLKLKREEKKPDAGAGRLAAGDGKAAAKKKKASVDEPDPEAEEDL